MASVKLNKLHLHATDSQAWPLEIPSLPELARNGAYQPGLVWTTQHLESIQTHGISKGVEVILEIDMPGHTASIAHAYPNLITAFNQLDWSTFALEPLSGQLKLNSSQVNSFMDTLFDDLLPRLEPFAGAYHLGGDEVNLPAYLLDDTVKSDDPDVIRPLMQSFMQKIYDKAVDHGLRPLVWEEMILEWHLDFSTGKHGRKGPKPLVQAWRNSTHIASLLEKGFPVIFGDSEHWYLDCGFGVFLDPYPSGKSPPGVPFNTSGGLPSRLDSPYLDYCSPYHNWRAMYTFDPLEGIPGYLHDGIEGGESLMWSEQTDGIDLDFKLWPRAAAAAEVLWSGPRKTNMIADATWRLGQWRERIVLDSHISASPVTMTWCLMEGGCVY
jgi:hexosaminidase